MLLGICEDLHIALLTAAEVDVFYALLESGVQEKEANLGRHLSHSLSAKDATWTQAACQQPFTDDVTFLEIFDSQGDRVFLGVDSVKATTARSTVIPNEV